MIFDPILYPLRHEVGYSVWSHRWSIWAFLSPGAQEPVYPQTIFVYFTRLKKIYIGHLSEEDNHLDLLPQQGFYTSSQIWDQLGVTWQTKQRGFFCHGFFFCQGPLISNILNSFSWPFLDLALYLCESFLVESPTLYLAFFKTILAAFFRTFGLPLRFLPSKPLFLHDHFTTQHSDFSRFLALSTTDKPVNRSIHAYALTQVNFFCGKGIYLSWYSQNTRKEFKQFGL